MSGDNKDLRFKQDYKVHRRMTMWDWLLSYGAFAVAVQVIFLLCAVASGLIGIVQDTSVLLTKLHPSHVDKCAGKECWWPEISELDNMGNSSSSPIVTVLKNLLEQCKLKIDKRTLSSFLAECDHCAPWFEASGSLTVGSWEKLGGDLD